MQILYVKGFGLKLLIGRLIIIANTLINSRHSKDDLLKFKPSIRMGEKVDLSDFERGLKCLVHARREMKMSRLVGDDRKAYVTCCH